MNTAEEHNRKLAYSHFAYAGFQLLMLLLMAAFFIFLMVATADAPGGAPPPLFITVFLIFATLFQLLFAIPSLIAGVGLLKKRQWAKTASIIAGVLSSMSFPVGTAVTVYTFWFLFSEPGKSLYDRPAKETAGRSDWYLNEPSHEEGVGNWSATRRREYAPPKEMPNWRE